MSWMFLNAEPVVWSASTAQHNEDYRHLGLIKRTSPSVINLAEKLVDTGTGGSQHCSIEKAGGSVLGVCTGSGGVRGLKCRRNSRNEEGFG